MSAMYTSVCPSVITLKFELILIKFENGEFSILLNFLTFFVVRNSKFRTMDKVQKHFNSDCYNRQNPLNSMENFVESIRYVVIRMKFYRSFIIFVEIPSFYTIKSYYNSTCLLSLFPLT
jgi:hypothetical protein